MTVAYIPKLTGNAFFEAANVGAQKYAADWGMTVEYMGDPTASAAAQVAVINNAVAQGVDAICISAVDAAGVSDALKEAAAAGIVISTWDLTPTPRTAPSSSPRALPRCWARCWWICPWPV